MILPTDQPDDREHRDESGTFWSCWRGMPFARQTSKGASRVNTSTDRDCRPGWVALNLAGPTGDRAARDAGSPVVVAGVAIRRRQLSRVLFAVPRPRRQRPGTRRQGAQDRTAGSHDDHRQEPRRVSAGNHPRHHRQRFPDIPAHGSRQMPVWGPTFHALDSSDRAADLRLANIVEYLSSIQRW